METIVKGVLLGVQAIPWKNEKEGKAGISYKALIYADKKVIDCKTSEEVFKDIGDKEFTDGTATIEIKKTNFDNKERVDFVLKKFDY